MLPEPFTQSFHAFFAALDQIESVLESGDSKQLQLTLPNLQEVVPHLMEGTNHEMSENFLEPDQVSRLRSIQTEINKEMRLLNADVIFLNTAKQPTTIQQRQQQIGDRLQSLRQYGEAALSLWNSSASES